MHHYNELYQDPAGHRERFLAIWRQIAERYQDRPLRLVFEPLNEPHDNLNAGEWNNLLKDVLGVIRRSNPARTIVFGPANYNDIRQLAALELPADDRNLIVSVHYYLPYEFTHQGAHWAPGSSAWLGMKWAGSGLEKQAIRDDFKVAADWAKKNHRPIFIGEFGANSKADMESRVRWTKCVADTAIEHGFSFTYWDFCAEFFGLYDLQARAWRRELLEAVVPPPAGLPSAAEPSRIRKGSMSDWLHPSSPCRRGQFLELDALAPQEGRLDFGDIHLRLGRQTRGNGVVGPRLLAFQQLLHGAFAGVVGATASRQSLNLPWR